jgi:chorismate mutase/prephenate dehydratase
MSGNSNIEDLRRQIDQLDQEILNLVNKRVICAIEIGALKDQSGDTVVYRPEREAKILQRLTKLNTGPLRPSQLQTLFREIISIARAAESLPCVAVLGPAGTHSQAAVIKHFGQEVAPVFADDIEDVFRLVESGEAAQGVVPVENSTEGGISNTLDCLVTTALSITGEINLKVRHSLLGQTKEREFATTILGHEQALAQCRHWLDRHLPALRRVAVSSNAEAARQASENSTCLAVAGKETAQIYGLKLLEQGIEDQPSNTTRFFVIGSEFTTVSGSDKTSLLLSSRNHAGSLQRLLEPLSEHGISMTRIESRPSRTGLWEYVFFIDFDGHVNDEIVQKALSVIEQEAALFKVLGSYPRAT